MLKALTLSALVSLSLVACTDYQQTQIDAAQRAITADNFKVQAVPEYNGQGTINIQYTGNNPIIIQGFELNKGNCPGGNLSKPVQMKYGDVYPLYLWNCSAENVLRIKIITNEGDVEYGF